MNRPNEKSRALVLVERLEAGWALCEAETDPRRRARLDEYWIGLLREYEAAVDAALVGARVAE